MLPQDKRLHLEALNRDHHRRMTANCADLVRTGSANWFLTQDLRSRAALYRAMLGCETRCEMRRDEPREVLELGAGSGRDRESLQTTFGATYTGIEVVREAAEKLVDSGVHHMAIEEMPDDWSQRFHFIYSRHVMEHVVDVDIALSRLKFVLAPNGIIGAVTPHVFPDNEPAHVTKLRAEEWHAAYNRHGLRVVYCPVEQYGCSETQLVAIHQEWPWPPRL